MILILAALCAAGWLCALLKCRVERALPLLPALGMLVMVPLAMARALWLTDVLSALLIAATAVALVARRERLRELGKRLLTPGLLAFAMLAALSYFATRGRVVWEWDEYSYWALKVKELWYFDGVLDSLHTLTPRFGDYLPGAQTLLWWTLRATGGWNESTLYFGMMLLNLTYLLPLTERLSWRRAGWLALLIPVMIALPTALSANIYVSLGVDTLLGMQMGYLLYLIWEQRSERTKLHFVSALLTLCAMTLTKQVGLLWGAIALGFGAVIAQKGERKAALRRTLLLALPAVGCLMGWKAFCGANGLQNYLSAYAGENLSQMNSLSWFMPLGYKTFLLKTLKAFLFAPVSG
ncbi:MAG: hypothetical protein EOM69_08245, partial [Clostridia bacterium]|nr:hypothetical protein [Clostridia bacterium]